MLNRFISTVLFLGPCCLASIIPLGALQGAGLKAPIHQDQANVIDLASFEKHVCSQNGEDGIIEAIFSKIGTSSKYCVEFGAHDGFIASNTLRLRTSGWKALLLDDRHENISINLHKAFICKENINALFEQYKVPHDLDFLSIDIDFNDFHVWQALSDSYRPRLIVIEYNATFLPNEDKVVPYAATGYGDGTNYFGASIRAMYNLGRKKGYCLVYAENTGANLFFVREDLLKNQSFCFKNVNNVDKLYKKPTYGNGPNGGHRQDPLKRAYTTSKQLLQIA
jgi:hypothetical protein